MTEEQIRQIANEAFVETIMTKLDSAIIFKYIFELEHIKKEHELYKHRLEVANQYLESRKENLCVDHYDDLKYIVNECDLESTW